MQLITVTKEKLLVKMRENRDLHRKQFEEALNGWQERVLAELEKAVSDAKKGLKFTTSFNLPRPSDHTSEYDEIIEQVEWNEEEQIDLDLNSFNQFVRDDWGWKRDFITTNAFYTHG